MAIKKVNVLLKVRSLSEVKSGKKHFGKKVLSEEIISNSEDASLAGISEIILEMLLNQNE